MTNMIYSKCVPDVCITYPLSFCDCQNKAFQLQKLLTDDVYKMASVDVW